jgi:hypothetical protein
LSANAAAAERERIPIAVPIVLVAIVLACQLALVAHTPLLSEDWTQRAERAAIPSFFGALDPRIEPLRPLQHAYFWVIAHSGTDPAGFALPLGARAFAFALHAISCAFVYLLAREAGARRAGATAAVLLFALFPNVKSIAWPAAIGSPGRVCFELIALYALVRQARAPRAATGALALIAFVLALGFHESAMLLPAMFAAWIAFAGRGTVRDGIDRVRRALRDPWILALFALAFVYFVQLFLRPQRHHHAKALDALPANVVKAALALVPEWIRVPAVDGLRGQLGPAGYALGGGAVLVVALAALWILRRSAFGRFVVIAVGLELLLPVLGTGFAQRYAYFSSALVAIGLGVWSQLAATRKRALVVAAVTAVWGFDAFVDAFEYRAAGREAEWIAARARDERAHAGPGAQIAIVDPPDMSGAERDVPTFNWGLDYFLEAHGADGPWLLWRTVPFATNTNVELVDRERIERARREGAPALIELRH